MPKRPTQRFPLPAPQRLVLWAILVFSGLLVAALIAFIATVLIAGQGPTAAERFAQVVTAESKRSAGPVSVAGVTPVEADTVCHVMPYGLNPGMSEARRREVLPYPLAEGVRLPQMTRKTDTAFAFVADGTVVAILKLNPLDRYRSDFEGECVALDRAHIRVTGTAR